MTPSDRPIGVARICLSLLLPAVLLGAQPGPADTATNSTSVPAPDEQRKLALVNEANGFFGLEDRSVALQYAGSYRLTLSPDGTVFAASSRNLEAAFVFAIPLPGTTPPQLPAAAIRMPELYALRITADNRRLVSLATSSLLVHDLPTGAKLAEWPLQTNQSPNLLAVSPDGTRAAVSDSGCVTVLDLATGTVVAPRTRIYSLLGHLSYSPDGRLLLVAGDSGACVLAAADLTVQARTSFDLPNRSWANSHVQIAPDFSAAAFSDEKGDIVFRSLPDLAPQGEVVHPALHERARRSDGTSLFLVDWSRRQALMDDTADKWNRFRLVRIDLATGAELSSRDWDNATDGFLAPDSVHAAVVRSKYESYQIVSLAFPFGGRAEKVLTPFEQAGLLTPDICSQVAERCFSTLDHDGAERALMRSSLPEAERHLAAGKLFAYAAPKRAAAHFAAGSHGAQLQELALSLLGRWEFDEILALVREYKLDERPLRLKHAQALRKIGKEAEFVAQLELAGDVDALKAYADELAPQDPERALALYTRLNLPVADLHRQLGRLAFERNDLASARSHFQAAGDAQGLEETALRLIILDQEDDAFAIVDQQCSPEMTTRLSVAAMGNGKYEVAVKLCAKVDDAGLSRQLLAELEKAGDLARAATLAQRIGDKTALRRLATALDQKGFADDAVNILLQLDDLAGIAAIAAREEAAGSRQAALRHYDLAHAKPATYEYLQLRVKAEEFAEKLYLGDSFIERYNAGKVSLVFRRMPGDTVAYLPEDAELYAVLMQALSYLGKTDPTLAWKVAADWQAEIRPLLFDQDKSDNARAGEQLRLLKNFVLGLDLVEAFHGRTSGSAPTHGEVPRMHANLKEREQPPASSPAQN